MPEITPQEIVAELDKHIIGQGEAKRAVAIALRNRWRRMQIEEPMRFDVYLQEGDLQVVLPSRFTESQVRDMEPHPL